jgi:hypothetical protein
MVEYLLNDNAIAVFEHMQRNCVYQEAEACIKLRKAVADRIRAQVEHYRHEGYPYNNGLAETTAVLRKHTPEINALGDAWWTEMKTWTLRDQLSLDYLCWKHDIQYAQLEGGRTESTHFTWRPHR